MDNIDTSLPAVLTFAGNDPSGGAGIIADIEALSSMGCQALPIVTAITVQDSQTVHKFKPVDAAMVAEQANVTLADIPISAVKVSFFGSKANVLAIAEILKTLDGIPIILDPVLASGDGTPLVNDDMIDEIIHRILPLTTVITPNSIEVMQLVKNKCHTQTDAALELLKMGPKYVLLTGTHNDGKDVVHEIYHNNKLQESIAFARLPHVYHGSGCTLAAALAGLLAGGVNAVGAIKEALEYTYAACMYGYKLGKGAHIPNRYFWTNSDDEHFFLNQAANDDQN